MNKIFFIIDVLLNIRKSLDIRVYYKNALLFWFKRSKKKKTQTIYCKVPACDLSADLYR